MQTRVDLRCPEDRRALLGRIRETDAALGAGNLLEIQCRVCTRNGKQIDSSVLRVVHCFDFSGTLVESLVQREG